MIPAGERSAGARPQAAGRFPRVRDWLAPGAVSVRCPARPGPARDNGAAVCGQPRDLAPGTGPADVDLAGPKVHLLQTVIGHAA